MRSIVGVLVVAFACGVSQPALVLAKGSGGHGGGHGGGHSSGHGGGHSSHGGGHGTGRATSRSGGTHTASPRTSSASHSRPVSRSGGAPSVATWTDGTRPRDGRPVLGTAVPRPQIIPAAVPNPFFTAPLIIWPRYAPGFRFSGLGYYGYYGYPPLDAYPLPGAYAADPFDSSGPTGKLRLQIEPRSSEVFVDGFYAGIVDDFDGIFQRLTLAAGPHHVVVSSPGYQPLSFEVLIESHQTTTYRGVLQR